MARFFIHRPVFAWVLAIITMLAGVYGLSGLPIAQYPDIAPTTVRISATYTGASPDIVENSVTSIIEDGMTGLDGLTYMTSTSSQGGKGRDHNPYVFTNWLCGGGIKRGLTHGESDHWGYKPLDRTNPTQVYDIHATLLCTRCA